MKYPGTSLPPCTDSHGHLKGPQEPAAAHPGMGNRLTGAQDTGDPLPPSSYISWLGSDRPGSDVAQMDPQGYRRDRQRPGEALGLGRWAVDRDGGGGRIGGWLGVRVGL